MTILLAKQKFYCHILSANTTKTRNTLNRRGS